MGTEETGEEYRLIRRYLLGELREGERVDIERRLMTDEECFDSLLLAEADLADEYTRGELSDSDRQRFEDYFLLAPERRRDLRFAKALTKYASAASSAPSPVRPSATADLTRPLFWWQSLASFGRPRRLAMTLALAAVFGLLVVTGVWLLSENRRLSSRIEQLQSQQLEPDPRVEELRQQLANERARSGALGQQLERERIEHEETARELAILKQQGSTDGGRSGRSFVSVVLTAGMMRGGGELATVTVTPGVQRVRLQLILERDDYAVYRVDLRNDQGIEVWSNQKLTADRTNTVTTLVASVPARLLARGDYIVTVSGVTPAGNQETAGRYGLRVVAR